MIARIRPKLEASQRLSLWLMVIITLLAFGLRLYRLDSQSLRGDEAASATYASLSFAEILDIARTADPHPPLFYLVLGLWERLAGASEFAVRFWVVIPAVLTVPLLYQFGRRLVGVQTGVMAAFLLAVNSFHIWHAQDVRSYTWFILFGLLTTVCLWRALQQPTWMRWFLYGLTVIIIFYLHYYSAFLLLFHGLYVGGWFLFAHQRPRPFRPIIVWAVTVFIALLLFLPWLGQSWQFVTGFTGDFAPAMPQMVLWRGLLAFSGGIVETSLSDSGWVLLYILFAGVGVVGLRFRQKMALILLLLYFWLPYVGIMLLTLRGQAFTERYLLAALPPFLLLVAAGLKLLGQTFQAGQGWILAIVIGLTLWWNGQALADYHFQAELAKSPQWQAVFDYIAQHRQPETDMLIYDFPEAAVTYYLDTYLSPARRDHQLPVFLVPPEANPPQIETEQFLQTLTQSYQRIWFVPVNARGWDDDAQVERWLNRHADRQQVADFHWIRTELYLTPTEIERSMQRQPVQFANGITLRGFQVFNTISTEQQIVSLNGDSLDLSLYWLSAGATETPLTVFTQLIDESGFLRGGQDNEPVWGQYPTTAWQVDQKITDKFYVTPQAEAPPGIYQVWIGLYNGQTGERVAVVDQAGQPIADHVILDIKVKIE